MVWKFVRCRRNRLYIQKRNGLTPHPPAKPMRLARSVPFSESMSTPRPKHHRMTKGAKWLTFRGIEHIAISSVDNQQLCRLICGVCHKERVYEILLDHA